MAAKIYEKNTKIKAKAIEIFQIFKTCYKEYFKEIYENIKSKV